MKPTAAPSGKLFFTIDGEPFVCSASSVNSPNRSLIITAGHCVHEGPSGAWFDDFAYVPGYRDGRAPYGIWGWEEVNTFKGWSKFGDSDYDQALIQVEKLNGRRLVDKVGAHGLTTGVSQAQKAVRAVGWPAAEPFTGERVVTCDGATTRRAKTNDAALRCRMTGGSSGGPWLIKRVAPMQGNVFAVTSRGARSGTPTIFAAPIRPAIKDLVKSIG